MTLDTDSPPVDEPRADLVDLRSGELLPATPENAAMLIVRMREFRSLLMDGIKECERILIDESTRVGSKTLRVGGHVAEIAGGSEVVWDVEALRAGLRKAGCPDERLAELITETVEYRVNNTVARQLASANPKYANVIEGAKARHLKGAHVRIKT